jgi:ubiquinone/menaquinone biosynthesis C-methylase UbiE
VRPGVRAFWNSFADRYDDRFDERSGDGHALRVRQDAVLRFMGDGPGSVLDAGMGPGRLCSGLAARGWSVSGVDASAEMVALARRRLPDCAERLVEASIEDLPFAEATFDGVTATGVLEYTNVPVAVAELSRVLKPGGRAVISYPHARSFYRAWKTWAYYPAVRAVRRLVRRPGATLPRGAGAIEPQAFERLLEEAGISPVDRVLTSALPVPAPLDTLMPRFAEAMARRVEGGRLARAILSTQVVYVGVKRPLPTAERRTS